MNLSHRGTHHSARGVLAVALACTAPLAGAASHTWSGNGADAKWSTAANWSAGGAPADNETNVTLLFPAGGLQQSTMVNDRTNLSVASMTFQNTGYRLTGNAIALAGSITADGGTNYNAARVGVDIALTAPAQFIAGNSVFLQIDGVISGAQPVTAQSIAGTYGVVFFEAANTYTGTTTVASGYLQADNALALGVGDGTPATGTVVTSGATLVLGGKTFANEHLTIGGGGFSGNAAIQSAGNATNVWGGPIVLTANTTIAAIGTAGLKFDGAITGAFGMTWRTAAGATLTAKNGYSGASTIEYGRVWVMGVQPGTDFALGGYSTPDSTLGGTGAVGNVSLANGSATPKILHPGPPGGPGVLYTKNLSLVDAQHLGRLDLVIDGPALGTDYAAVSAAGSVDVSGATLQVSLGYSPPLGTAFLIVANDGADPVVGTFAGLKEGAVLASGSDRLRISYHGGTGNDIVLTATDVLFADGFEP